MSENKIEQEYNNGKLGKYGITRKSVYAIGSVLLCIILVIVLSVTQAAFDPEKLQTAAFWIEFVILSGFSIFGMVGGQKTSEDIYRNKSGGAFRKALGRFLKLLGELTDSVYYAYLDDWLESYRERKLKRKIEVFLKGLGIKQMEVLDLDLTELDSLKQPFKKDWKDTIYEGKYPNDTTYFLSCSDEQIEAIKFVFAGGIKVSNLSSTYFTTAVGNSDKDMWESAAKQEQKKGSYIAVNYSYRIVMLLILCIVSTALTTGMFNESTAETILTLVKRLFCILSAYVWGVFLGIQLVKIDVEYLDFKVEILRLFSIECKNGIYKHKDINKIAQEEYEKLNEEREEEVNEFKESV